MNISRESIENIPTGLPGGFFIYASDDAETILFAEENVIRLYDCDSFEQFMEFTGGSFRGMVHPDDLPRIENEIQAQTMFGEKRHDYVRYQIITKKGNVRYVEDFGHLLHGKNGESFFYVFIVDVDADEFLNRSRNSFAEAQVLSMNSDTDTLTGLFNMAFFYQAVSTRIARKHREHLSILHFDIPNFKLFNERNGFHKGDELLCDIAKTLLATFPDSICARFSDDHFAVCTPGSRENVISRVENVCRKIMLAEDPAMRVRIKAGIYYMNDRYAEVGLACDHARLACNSIKSRHDVYYCVYDEMLRDRLRRQQYVLDHIDEAIENEYIKVYYQPVIRVATGEICGYEALARWADPTYKMLSPADFIETLEHYHLIQNLDFYIINRVAEDYAELKRAGEPVVPVSVNLSRLDFELRDVPASVEEILRKNGMPRCMMDLEVTESALNDNEGFLRSECERLRNLGYEVWLDDFGSGYSSLNTLAEYEFDVLKLDMVFLRSFDRNPRTAALMEYIVQGVRGMGISPLCEGVESKEHFEFLKKIGCVRAQGYYFSKPMPMAETREYTRAKGMVWEEQD
ncbi:MAG: GGDEF and EAL domain-containing protein [Solobacterium sp.]|nr:GGDEF and EAL domain-containing protein [Solobacterium sp.]